MDNTHPNSFQIHGIGNSSNIVGVAVVVVNVRMDESDTRNQSFCHVRHEADAFKGYAFNIFFLFYFGRQKVMFVQRCCTLHASVFNKGQAFLLPLKSKKSNLSTKLPTKIQSICARR
jgi:hypothetical protein